MKVDAITYRTHKPFNEIHWVSRLRENFTSGSDGEGLETGQVVTVAPRQSFTRQTFFKTLKQLLKIKTFVGTSKNAVLIQIWTALITILILKYLKQVAKYDWCLSNLVAFLRMNLFVKIDLQKWRDKPFEPLDPVPRSVQLGITW